MDRFNQFIELVIKCTFSFGTQLDNKPLHVCFMSILKRENIYIDVAFVLKNSLMSLESDPKLSES